MAARILGISAFYNDSAATVMRDGEIVAAAQEERFTGQKQEHRFPGGAVDYCLSEANIAPGEVDYLVFYDRPHSLLNRWIERLLAWAPATLRAATLTVPERIRRQIQRPRQLQRACPGKFHQALKFVDHDHCHAACAFFPSPFEEAAILLWEDSGARTRILTGRGRGNKIELVKAFDQAVSLSPLYEGIAEVCGFHAGQEQQFGELAPYGEPKYVDLIRSKLLVLKNDGSFAINKSCVPRTSGHPKGEFHALFGGRRRLPDGPITRREMDLARSIQTVSADLLLHIGKTVREITGCRNLCLAGNMAAKAVAYSALVRENVFDDVWMPGCEGDASGALGAALFTHFQLLHGERRAGAHDSLKGSLLGPRFTNEEIHGFLRSQRIEHEYCPDEQELLQKTVEAMRAGKVVGWFQGRMEFATHALGGRSIIREVRSGTVEAPAHLPNGDDVWRPFSLSVLIQDAPAFFDLERESPYVHLVARQGEKSRLLKRRRANAAEEGDVAAYLEVTSRPGRKNNGNGDIAARIQTVDERRCGRYYRLIREFKRQTGSGMIMQTDFGMPGQPIVGSPQDAYRCFVAREIDMLVLENCIVHKQPPSQSGRSAEMPASPARHAGRP